MSERCPCCGQVIRKLNPHHMDAAKVRLLERIARMNLNGKEWVKVQRDGNLIRASEENRTIQCDDVHALRLTWFGLLESFGKRSGLYRVTQNGFRFLTGKYRVPKEILCRNGHVEKQSPETVTIKEVRNVIFDKAFWDSYGRLQQPASVPIAQPQLL